jgi:hypothetical protein
MMARKASSALTKVLLPAPLGPMIAAVLAYR